MNASEVNRFLLAKVQRPLQAKKKRLGLQPLFASLQTAAFLTVTESAAWT
jgi:hypothetical protein